MRGTGVAASARVEPLVVDEWGESLELFELQLFIVEAGHVFVVDVERYVPSGLVFGLGFHQSTYAFDPVVGGQCVPQQRTEQIVLAVALVTTVLVTAPPLLQPSVSQFILPGAAALEGKCRQGRQATETSDGNHLHGSLRRFEAEGVVTGAA